MQNFTEKLEFKARQTHAPGEKKRPDTHTDQRRVLLPLLSGFYHVAVAQPLVLIGAGSWWYFLSATRAEGGTG
ncbi:hypothetical protein Q5P01_018475 [Channa striata]|uniref:Uncharacterized protein n=1 Tax=Channa striata TaxID=64152 RepID=A0AA88SFZ2_CHASR|nr:hypothetical protein Q5P01_018475 [Channa striata]